MPVPSSRAAAGSAVTRVGAVGRGTSCGWASRGLLSGLPPCPAALALPCPSFLAARAFLPWPCKVGSGRAVLFGRSSLRVPQHTQRPPFTCSSSVLDPSCGWRFDPHRRGALVTLVATERHAVWRVPLGCSGARAEGRPVSSRKVSPISSADPRIRGSVISLVDGQHVHASGRQLPLRSGAGM